MLALVLGLGAAGALLGRSLGSSLDSSLSYSNDIELAEDTSYGSASAAEASEAWEALSEVSDDEVSSRPSGPAPRFPSTSLYEPQVPPQPYICMYVCMYVCTYVYTYVYYMYM
jgi:hypothetical protein